LASLGSKVSLKLAACIEPRDVDARGHCVRIPSRALCHVLFCCRRVRPSTSPLLHKPTIQ